MKLSYIQNQILKILLKADKPLRYSEAMPENVENDLYNYHLKFLTKKKLVKKENKLYSLTNKGKKHAHLIDLEGQMKNTFKVSATCYLVDPNSGKILHQKRLRQPYYGDILPILGNIEIAEPIKLAATRVLEIETNLKAKNWIHFGTMRKIMRDKEKRLIEDSHYHLLFTEDFEGDLEEKNIHGEHDWYEIEKVIKLQRKNITKSDNSEIALKKVLEGNLSFEYLEEDIILPNF